jgi:glycine/D-amino acid oxidase-like deaminating enzyme
MAVNQATDVAIIGGGVEACSIAYQLSKAGVQVSVIEREEIAAEASSAAAGKTIAELLTTGQTPALIQPFGIERFIGQARLQRRAGMSIESSY